MAWLKTMQIALLAVAALGQTKKYTDENRPYKFGFNIQGHQHRHEEKDENGIIKGEYGFITADGYYRVTVYATDENGDFKIISMKNYYVGFPPEDPTTTPAPERKSQGVVQLRFQQGNINNNIGPTTKYTTTTIVAPQITKTTPSPVVGRIGCSNCVIPTTTKRPKTIATNRPAYFQTTIDPSNYRQQKNQLTNERQTPNRQYQTNRPISDSLLQEVPVTKKTETKNKPGTTSNDPYSFVQQIPRKSSTTPQEIDSTKKPDINKDDKDDEFRPRSLQRFDPNNNPTPKNRPDSGQIGSYGPTQKNRPDSGQIGSYGPTQKNRPDSGQRGSYEERPGLPPGVTEKDIKDLLYRFNYTVGFHGHHEDGYRNGDKKGDYFFDGRDGIERKVDYIANEFGYQPNITLVNLPANDVRIPKEETEKEYGLKGYEFKWFYRK